MSTADSMRDRGSGSAPKLYVLLEVERWILAAGILAFVFTIVMALVALDPVPLDRGIRSGDPAETLFQALVTAIITGVTLVVSINSLVLSQELGALGDQRERMEGSLAFRDRVAAEIEEPVSPSEPSTFLLALLDRSRDRATDLRNATANATNATLRNDVQKYADEVVENASDVGDDLEGQDFGTFNVLSAALNFNYSGKIHDGKRIRREYADALDDSSTAALDDVIDALALFGTTREHVKTLYFQWELVNLSRAIIYAAVPALIVSIAAILTLDNPGSVPGETFGVANVSWVVVGAATLSLAPFAILLSFILRIATVAKRTLAIGPFVLRTTDDS